MKTFDEDPLRILIADLVVARVRDDEEAAERAADLERRLHATRAESFEVVLFKIADPLALLLREMPETQFEVRSLRSALRDLERWIRQRDAAASASHLRAAA